jgi:hypothetical protein
VNRFDFITHAKRCFCVYFYLACFWLFSIFFFFNTKKIYIYIGGEDEEFLFFLLIAFQIMHMFLPDISVHCALIKYAYI